MMCAERKGDIQPWATCFLTDILLSYLEDQYHGKATIDYPALFRGIEGIEVPQDPRAFLRNVNNWVPLGVLREVLVLAERVSGRKDIAYHAARTYFEEGQSEILSLFEIIFRVLNDVRSTVVCATHWAAVHTNYLKLQSFESPGPEPGLYMLAQFGGPVRPAVGSMHLVRGMAEGFPRLYSFIESLQCTEEISQLRIEDAVREFPAYRTTAEGDRALILRGDSARPVVEARKTPLRSEAVLPVSDVQIDAADAVVAPMRSGAMRILTYQVETDPQALSQAQFASRIVRPGTLRHNGLSFTFEEGHVYDAPYSRFRFVWQEKPRQQVELPIDHVRRQVSELLFRYLRQMRQTQTRIVQQHIEKSRLVLENIYLRREVEREYSFGGLVGQSKPIQELFGVIRSIAETDVSVLIQGETGTGKELIARAIHYNSPRKARRFVAVNCGALAETLLQSELFGHERGAFTGADARRKGIFEVADGGSLFLDEIGEISPSTQVKLLRVLEDGEFQRVGGSETIRVNVRVLSATNQNVEEMVKSGRFRQDLYYRLNVFPIRVPPLRERREDIPLLVTHFIEKAGRKMPRSIRGVNPEAMSLLIAFGWPGNVRELENVVQRMMVVAKRETLGLDDLPPDIRGAGEAPAPKGATLRGLTRTSTELVEKQTILDALAKTDGNVTHAAKTLGISRATLQNKMKAYNLRDSKPRRTT